MFAIIFKTFRRYWNSLYVYVTNFVLCHRFLIIMYHIFFNNAFSELHKDAL
jgi:hypothetical protein